MKILAVIPARYASQRFPGKPLAQLGDRPMIQWVYDAAKSCSAFDKVVVATDSNQIAERVRSFGGEVKLTRGDHATGTDRVAEVADHRENRETVPIIPRDQNYFPNVVRIVPIRIENDDYWYY